MVVSARQVTTGVASVGSPWWRVAAVGGAVALLSADEGVVLCPFRRITHGYCPLCGGTRAAGELLVGDPVGAWRAHPLVVLLAVQAVALGGLWLVSGRPIAARWWQRLLLADLALAVAIWAVRLAVGDVPAPQGLYAPLPLP